MKKILVICSALALIFLIQGCTGESHEDHTGHNHGEAEAAIHAEEEHEEHGGEKIVLTEEEIERIGLETSVAGTGKIERGGSFPGEVVLDPDRVAHVTPRISGTVSRTAKKLGDPVRKGEIVAVLESRELAETNAGYLAAQSRLEQARANFTREKELWEVKKITSEQEYLSAKQALEEAEIESLTLRRQLIALGLPENYLDGMGRMDDELLTRYEMRSPIEGIIIEKHAVLGETLEEGHIAFIIADLSEVWVKLNIYQKDLESVKAGQTVRVNLGSGESRDGTLGYVSPLLDEKTRTVESRVVLKNDDMTLKPGSFVTVSNLIESESSAVVIPLSAVQVLEEKEVVFIPEGGGFEAVQVMPGYSDGTRVEILSGLNIGDTYVVNGAFELKAEIVSSGMGAHAGHGH